MMCTVLCCGWAVSWTSLLLWVGLVCLAGLLFLVCPGHPVQGAGGYQEG